MVVSRVQSIQSPSELTKYNWQNDLELLSYQEDDIDYLLEVADTYHGALNLNCRGSGKTIEAIALALRLESQMVLIFCPNRLKLKWAREIKKWTGEKAVVTSSDPYRRYSPWFPKTGKRMTFANTRWFITNVEQFRRRDNVQMFNSMISLRLLKPIIIIDEAHRLRNPDAQQSRGVYALDPSIPKFLLTGTPAVNSAFDYYSLFHIVDPEGYNSPQLFMKTYTMGYFWRGTYRATGNRNPELLRKEISDRGIQHSKEEILPFLPALTRDTIPLEMEPRQREVYLQMEEELMIMLDDGQSLWAPNVLAKATRLRQLLCHPPMLGITAPSVKTSSLSDIIDFDEPTVIFTAFERYVDIIINELIQAESLSGRGREYKVGRFTGKESNTKSDRVAEEFQRGEINCLVGTLKSMNEGQDLFAGSHVIFTDRWWNSSTNEQAEDRLHRIGQNNPVRVSIMEVSDSFDEAMDEIISRKKHWTNELEIREETIEKLREMRAKR